MSKKNEPPQLSECFMNAFVGLGSYSEDISLFTILWIISVTGCCLVGRPCVWGIWQKAR